MILIKKVFVLFLELFPSVTSYKLSSKAPPTLQFPHRHRTANALRSQSAQWPASSTVYLLLSATGNPPIALHFLPNFLPCPPTVHTHKNSTQSLSLYFSAVYSLFLCLLYYAQTQTLFSMGRVCPIFRKVSKYLSTHSYHQIKLCCECA